MKARFPAVLAAVTLIAAACAGTPASPSAAHVGRRLGGGRGRAVGGTVGRSLVRGSVGSGFVGRPVGGRRRPTTLRVSRISDFLPSIHPVDLGTGNQELMADIVFSTLVDVDKDEVTILPDLAQTWDGHRRTRRPTRST